jgi:Txe/YoeB family toxin of Txe-Axe toxin-antitoxin module
MENYTVILDENLEQVNVNVDENINQFDVSVNTDANIVNRITTIENKLNSGKLITVSSTEPLNPELNDLWLEI